MSGEVRPVSVRPVDDRGRDDMVLPFAVEPLDLRGRVVRLGPSIDRIVAQHAYPPPVARLVGEAAALTALLGASLKFEGRLQLQTKSDGVADMLVVDFDAPDRLRAFARYDAARLATLPASTPADLLGSGHLALTIDQGSEASRYQGIVALEGQGLEAAAHRYFRRSEQIPTFVRLAVAQNITGAGANWRAGGLIAQFLPASAARRRQRDLDPGDAPPRLSASADFHEDDAWVEAKALAATLEDHELVDPTLSSERVLYRLFHERGVRVFEPQPLRDACRCSRERIAAMLRSFTRQERTDMVGEDGRIGVTCEFCSTYRAFDPAGFDPQ
jgi:molecular chaperone Hsp33